MPPTLLSHLLVSALIAVLIVGTTLLGVVAIIFFLKRWLFEIANSLVKRAVGGKQGKLIHLLQVILEGSKAEERTGFYTVPLLNRGEQQLYHRLVEAIPDHIILAEVAYSQFLKHKDFSEFSRMKQKVPDFVVCDSNFNVITIIELDGPSHDSKKEKDQERDAHAAEAGIKTVRWHVSNLPDRTQIRWKVLGLKETESDSTDTNRWAPH